MVPLFAGLLSIPLPAQYPPLTLTPPRQRRKTLEALLAWLLAEAARHPVLLIVEDLHWGDLSTLEFLSLVVEQVPAARLCALFTHRPAFQPLWVHRLKAAQILSLPLPPVLLLRADEVIE